MSDLTRIPPARRPELVLKPLGNDGQYVAKDPRTGDYYNLGEPEYYLLLWLDGVKTVEAICRDFETQFGEPLPEDDLRAFLELAYSWGFLKPIEQPGGADGAAGPPPQGQPAAEAPASPGARPGQSLLYWRRNFYDPDRLFDRLEPRLRFFWTGSFLAASMACILTAGVVTWANWQEMANYLPQALHWKMLVLAWLTMIVVTVCHEFAHGLTCKHYGGEVHEVGFLFIFLTPSLYCNVSDAWLIREKGKRLWVTLAGGYCDLVLWALAVFVWRLTPPDGALNRMAWVAMSVCGVGTIFNFNPLLKLDGYYLVSDLVEVPNLQSRSLDTFKAHLRWLFWGTPRPARESRGRLLLGFGIATWLFSFGFLSFMLVMLVRHLGAQWGLAGVGATVLLGAIVLPGLFRGMFAGEVREMIRTRRKRAVVWSMALVILPAVLGLGKMEDTAYAPFQIRPATRAELRAPIAGFLRGVYYDEGDHVSPGALVALLDVPDLASRVEQARAGVAESEARLELLEVGTRPEEIVQQRHRIERAKGWRDKARSDLARTRQSMQEELAQADHLIVRHRAELTAAAAYLKRSKQLLDRGGLSHEQYQEAETRYRVVQTLVDQAQAQKLARQARGTLEAEAELARREKDLADVEAVLALLEAGTRPEEVKAERARLARFKEEVRFLEELQDKLQVSSPLHGVVATPRFREKTGQYFREGELIGEVVSSSTLTAEIALSEQDVARVRPGQRIKLRARALPFEPSWGKVERIAPNAVTVAPGMAQAQAAPGELASTVTVHCRVEDANSSLRPGMTGYARIDCDRRPIGDVLARRAMRLLRAEFWW